ncbi:type II RES/Xre toxin-antitoxin system antitoxin [Robertkochia flava]|uniref:type II RES/Xre toxin-antitoxin system antitoxin n=1 Tax=Robertkochia flava TaxID=3447986 RepID=UPI001CCFB876|nr:antitoxin Xre/MbcA/ParS toxin-binding domain-containing protein [Robertkochia marina]
MNAQPLENDYGTGHKALDKAIRTYLRKIGDTAITADKNFTYSDFLNNKMLIIRSIREGIPYRLFAVIREATPFSEEDWAAYLNISRKTLLRHKNDPAYLFKPIHTEKIIELAEVTYKGKSVFDSSEQFYLWLKTPCFALGQLKPAELLRDSYGKELVMNELNRIDHGIFA